MGVLFSKSPQGDSEELVTADGQNPQIQDQILVVLSSASDWVENVFSADAGPERWICIAARNRVSLKSCSGAIHDGMLWWCRVCLLFENSIVCQVC